MTATAEGVETVQQQELLRAGLLRNAGLSVQSARAGVADIKQLLFAHRAAPATAPASRVRKRQRAPGNA
jgi:hypothetical protein